MLPLMPSGHPEEDPSDDPHVAAGKDIVHRDKNLECLSINILKPFFLKGNE